MEYVIYGLLILFCFEIVIAFIVYPLKNGNNFYVVMREHIKQVWQYDDELGFSLKPNNIYSNPTPPFENAPRKILYVGLRTDKNGFSFAEDLEDVKKQSKLIFCMGASTTQGVESPHNYTFPSILDSLTKKNGYRCINSGVGGYRSIHELLYLKRILPHKPTAIILFSGYNDFEGFAYGPFKPYDQFTHCFSHSLPTNRLEKVLNESATFYTMKKAIYHLMKKVRTESISPSQLSALEKALSNNAWVDEWKKNIGEFIDICNENKIQCFLLSHASPCYENATSEAKEFANKDLNMNNRFDYFVRYLDVIHKATISICDKKGAIFIDVRRKFDKIVPFQKRFGLFTDRMHFTKEGNELLAHSIYREIKNIL